MPAMESALETSAMMSGQLVASATVSSMLISLPLGRIPRYSAATGHEPSSGQIVAPRSTHAREQPSSAPLPRISSSRFALTVASELKNYDKLATAVPRTMSRSLSMDKQ